MNQRLNSTRGSQQGARGAYLGLPGAQRSAVPRPLRVTTPLHSVRVRYTRRRVHQDQPGVCVAAAAAAAPATALSPAPRITDSNTSSSQGSLCQEPWLHQAIPGLVRQLSAHAAGCLQLITEPLPGMCTFTYKQLTSDEAHTPQTWSSILSSSSPTSGVLAASAVILARPIPDPSQVCPLTHTTSSSSAHSDTCQETNNDLQLHGSVDLDNCCSGSRIVTSTPATDVASQTSALHAELQARARQLLNGTAPDSNTHCSSSSSSNSSGSSEEEAAAPPPQQTPRSRRRFLRRQAAKAAAAATVTGAAKEPLTSYYGLAVQRLHHAPGAANTEGAFDGCYVLKLSRNRDVTGCTCTVFSLTRVCRGQPLHTQLQAAWLAV